MSEIPGVYSVGDILKQEAEREARSAGANPWDPEHRKGFVFDDEAETVDLYWWHSRDPYWISYGRISTPEKALGWLAHITEKNWKGTTPDRIHLLIEALASRFGWSIHGM